MKTQFSFYKRGFTLIEIMVVIAIVAFLFALMSQVNFRAQENITKAERMANKLQNILHTSAVAVMMGRMDQNKIAATGATIRISTSTWVSWNYTSSLNWSFVPPFFDSDNTYQIYSIKWCKWTSSWVTNLFVINMTAEWASFSGSTTSADPWITSIADTNILEIQLRYVDMIKKVIYDKRTGKIEVRREWEITCK